ncbi:MAG: methyltransferase domain-containing protein [Clostridiales bacterium]|jgi:glycosyltransferase involved in cell wall biosynthesis|nr:methyltransferase domain-containing protein [Clostridiales bacterium]
MDNMKQLQDAIRREDWNGALEIMEKLEPEQRKCLEGFYVLGMLSLHCQQYEQAQGFFVSALEYKMDDPACLYQLGFTCFQLGQMEEAEEFVSHCEAAAGSGSIWSKASKELRKSIQASSHPRKVLMAAYYFPPLAGSGVYRSIKFAKYLPDYQWTPVVVSTDRPPKGWNFSDESMVGEIPEQVDVHRIPDPVNTIQGGVSFTLDYMQEVLDFLGFVLEDHPEGKRLYEKLLQSDQGRKAMLQFPCGALCWAYEASQFIERSVDFASMDVMYTTSGPSSAHLIGYYFKKKYGMPWVADFRDEWTNNPYANFDRKQPVHQLMYDLEKLILQHADCSLTISEVAVENYIRTFSIPKEKIISITNGYDEWDFRNIYFPKEKNAVFTITYSGLLYTQQRNMSPIFAAIQELIREGKIDQEKIKFRIMGSSEQDNLSLAKKYQLEDNLHLMGYSPHQKALQLCVDSDLLLLFIGDDVRFKGVYTGKVFEYLRCGRPILALGPKNGVVDHMLRETGHGKTMTSKETKEIKEFILRHYQEWESSRENVYQISDHIQKYERRYLTGILAQALAGAALGDPDWEADISKTIQEQKEAFVSKVEEFPSDVYDKAYRSGGAGGSYHKHYTQSFYYPSWLSIRPYLVLLDRDTAILDIGCGVGQFANFLFDQGFSNYRGLDFSGEAIRIAKESNPEHAQKFFQGDAFQSDFFAGQYDLVIMFEILEHINQDLELIELVRPGTKMIVSVPNFPDPYHVRYFQNIEEVSQRYGQVMNIFDTKTFALNAHNKLFYVIGEKK